MKKFKQFKPLKTLTEYQKEIRKSSNTAITAAFGFLIALTWRDTIKELISKITAISPIQTNLITAILTTIVCVLGITLTNKILNIEDKNNK